MKIGVVLSILLSATVLVLFQNCGDIQVAPTGTNNSSSTDQEIQFTENFLISFIYNLNYLGPLEPRVEINGVNPFVSSGPIETFQSIYDGQRSNLTPSHVHKVFFDDDNVEDIAFESSPYIQSLGRDDVHLHIYSGRTGVKLYEKHFGEEDVYFVGDINFDGQIDVLGYDYRTSQHTFFNIQKDDPSFRRDFLNFTTRYSFVKNGQTYVVYPSFSDVLPDINGNGYAELLFKGFNGYHAIDGYQDRIVVVVDSQTMDFENPLYEYFETENFNSQQLNELCYQQTNFDYCSFPISVNYRNNKLYVAGKSNLKIYTKQSDHSFRLQDTINYPVGYKPIRHDHYRPQNDIQFPQNTDEKFLFQFIKRKPAGSYEIVVGWFDTRTKVFDTAVTDQIRTLSGCGAECNISDYEIQIRGGKTFILATVNQPLYRGLHYLLNLTDGVRVWRGPNHSNIWTQQLILLREKD